MPELKIINTYNTSSNYSTLKLFILSEGYVNQKSFYTDCTNLQKKILSHTPFNILINASFIESSLIYIASEHHGPYLETFGNNLRLNFDTVLNEKSQLLTLNLSKLKDVLTDLESQAISPLDGLSLKDVIIVVLTPSVSTNGIGGSVEYLSQSDDDPSFVATTTDGYWEQVVIRAIGRYFGLGDEFELDGADYLEPKLGNGVIIDEFRPNLIYDDFSLESMDLADTKWNALIPSNLKNQEQEIHRHVNHPLHADDTISSYSSINSNVLWEGGGGFRTKIYRYAHDCLMRRRIGSKSLSIKTSKVPLCHICESYIRYKIMQGAKTRSGEPLYFNGVSRTYNFG